jgi:hypothetical protein
MIDRRVYVAVVYSGDEEYICNFYSESEEVTCSCGPRPEKIWQYQVVSIKSEIH